MTQEKLEEYIEIILEGIADDTRENILSDIMQLIDHIASVARQEGREEAINIFNKLNYIEFAIDILKNIPTGMFDSTPYKEEQLKSLEKELELAKLTGKEENE